MQREHHVYPAMRTYANGTAFNHEGTDAAGESGRHRVAPGYLMRRCQGASLPRVRLAEPTTRSRARGPDGAYPMGLRPAGWEQVCVASELARAAGTPQGSYLEACYVNEPPITPDWKRSARDLGVWSRPTLERRRSAPRRISTPGSPGLSRPRLRATHGKPEQRSPRSLPTDAR